MAVISCVEIAEGRKANYSLDKRGVPTRTYSRPFRVITDSMLTGQFDVQNAVGLPASWAYYATETESDLACRLTERDATQDSENPQHWLVECRYTNQWRDDTIVENPLDRPYEMSWDNRENQQAVETDEQRNVDYPDGRPVNNSAAEPYDPPIMQRATLLGFTIIINKEFFDASLYSTYLNPNATNDAPFFGFLEGQVLCANITAPTEKKENGITFVPVTLKFEVVTGLDTDGNPITWDRWLLDRGYSYLVAPDVRAPILDEVTHQVVTKPRLLDGSGQQWDGVHPFYLGPFVLQPRKDFSLLGLS